MGPIYRWLDKQVGRPWNKVHSELCQVLDKRKLTHAHVFTHVDGYVEKNVYMGPDGQFYPTTGFFTFHHSPVKGLYVHPKTGLIRRQKPRPEPEKPRETTKIKLEGLKAWEKLSGIWYLVEYREPTPVERLSMGRDPILVYKRQLGKKQLRELRARLEA